MPHAVLPHEPDDREDDKLFEEPESRRRIREPLPEHGPHRQLEDGREEPHKSDRERPDDEAKKSEQGRIFVLVSIRSESLYYSRKTAWETGFLILLFSFSLALSSF